MKQGEIGFMIVLPGHLQILCLKFRQSIWRFSHSGWMWKCVSEHYRLLVNQGIMRGRYSCWNIKFHFVFYMTSASLTLVNYASYWWKLKPFKKVTAVSSKMFILVLQILAILNTSHQKHFLVGESCINHLLSYSSNGRFRQGELLCLKNKQIFVTFLRTAIFSVYSLYWPFVARLKRPAVKKKCLLQVGRN